MTRSADQNKHKQANADRDRAIVLMREGGMSLRKIAEEVGLSAERVRGVLARAWCDAQPLESWPPEERLRHFAPSARAACVIWHAVSEFDGRWWGSPRRHLA